MFPDLRSATRADLMAVYHSHRNALRELARELEIPPAEAEKLIDDVLFAALLLKQKVDPEKWLAATLTAAAKRRTERGE